MNHFYRMDEGYATTKNWWSSNTINTIFCIYIVNARCTSVITPGGIDQYNKKCHNKLLQIKIIKINRIMMIKKKIKMWCRSVHIRVLQFFVWSYGLLVLARQHSCSLFILLVVVVGVHHNNSRITSIIVLLVTTIFGPW